MNLKNHRWTMVMLVVIACLLLALGVATVISTAANPATASPAFRHVKPTASGSGDCTTWDSACTLQTALTEAVTGDEIWVMRGVYTPTTTGTDRTATLQLKSGVAVYGGFLGTESSLEDRDWQANITVLSGDIDNNDITDPSGVITTTSNITGTNSYHVVTGSGTEASAILDGFTVTGGNAAYPHDNGGGMYNEEGSPTVSNVTFSGNSAATLGGGMYNRDGSPSVTNVTFSGNSASYGGGMQNYHGSPTLTKVIFTANTATHNGGGMHNEIGRATVTNVTFISNTASYGGGMHNLWADSGLTLTNVTFSGNHAGHGGGMANSDSRPTLTNVTFSGNTASYGGGVHNHHSGLGAPSNPVLTNCILWGNTASSGAQIHNEMTCTPTVNYSLVEGACPDGATCDENTIYEDPQFVDPDGSDDTPGTLDDNSRLQLTSPAVDAGDNSAVPSGIVSDLDGRPRIVGGTVDMGAYEAPPHRLCVDQDAAGSNNGACWADALPDLQDALTWAVDGAEIWVAEGTYKPGTDRSDSFRLLYGVALYGGFEGNETARDQRNWTVHETVLSGDVQGNDNDNVDPTEPTRADNSYHVVTASGTDATAILDGFTVTGGNANGTGDHSRGGGMYNYHTSSPAVTHVTFSGNTASVFGGGMSNICYLYNPPTEECLAGTGSNPILTHVTFSRNSAGNGGGMYNYGGSSPTLTNVTFTGNSATGSGGGMSNRFDSDPKLINVIFTGNSANGGGGMSNGGQCGPTLINVTFTGNEAHENGGAIYNFHEQANPEISNCILWGNTASSGPQIYNDGASTTVTYSDIQDGYPGIGNIDADPLFVRNPDPGDGDWTTPDDNDYGDLRLQLTSPAIDAGNNNDLPKDTCDLDGDWDTDEPLPLDLDGLCRCVDIPDRPDTGVGPAPIVDMGACEARLHVYLPLVLKNYAP